MPRFITSRGRAVIDAARWLADLSRLEVSVVGRHSRRELGHPAIGGVILILGPPAAIDHAAAVSSLSGPRITIMSTSSSNGSCNAFASSQGARIQTSRSSSVVRITGMALG